MEIKDFHLTLHLPGHLTGNYTSNDALILEARALLAYRYKYNARCVDAMKVFSEESPLSILELLTLWDSYNHFMYIKNRQKYFEIQDII